jgi:hypothetical protein
VQELLSPSRTTLHGLAPKALSQFSLSFGEALPAARIRAAWEQLIPSHPLLGCGFTTDRDGCLIASPASGGNLPWTELDWSKRPVAELAIAWADELLADANTPLDPATPPPLRVTSILLPDQSTHLLITTPRFLLDEEDWFFLLCGLLERIEGRAEDAVREPSSPQPPDVSWWKEAMAGRLPAELRHFPSDPQAVFDHSLTLPRELLEDLGDSCRAVGCSVRSAVVGAWGLITRRLAHAAAPMFLADSDGNPDAGLMPFLLPNDAGLPLSDFVRAVGAVETSCTRHGAAPLSSLELPPGFRADGTGFLSVVRFLPPPVNHRIAEALPRWVNLDARLVEAPLHRLELEVREGQALHLRVRGRGLVAEEARRLLDRCQAVLATLVEDAASPAASAGAQVRGRDVLPTAMSPPLETLVSDLVADGGGDLCAVEDGDGAALSFREVDEYASILASHLHGSGLGEGWVGGICLSASPWVPVVWLGILRAGDTLLPLDPDAPRAWLALRAEAADAHFVICDSVTESLWAGAPQKIIVVDRDWAGISTVSPLRSQLPQPSHALVLAGTVDHSHPPIQAVPSEILNAAIPAAIKTLGIGRGDRVAVSALPGDGAFADALLCALAAGATAVLDPGKSPTHAFTTPAGMRAMVRNAALPATVAVNFRSSFPHGGAAVPDGSSKLPVPRLWQYASPFDLFAAGVVGPLTTAGQGRNQACGNVAPFLKFLHEDPAGNGCEIGYPGMLRFYPGESPNPAWSVKAWKDGEGRFTLLDSHDVWEGILFEAGLVEDVAVSRKEGGRIWYVGSADATALRAALSSLGKAAAEIHKVEEIPLRGGCPDFTALARLTCSTETPPPPITPPPPTPAGLESQPAPKPEVPAVTAAAPPVPEGASEEPEPLRAASGIPRVQPKPSFLLPMDGPAEAPLLVFVHASGRSPADCSILIPHLVPQWRVAGIRHLQGIPPDPAALALGLADERSELHLFGVGEGGLLAFDVVKHLRGMGREVPFLVVAGAAPPLPPRAAGFLHRLSAGLRPGGTAALRGSCGIVLTSDLPQGAEQRWLQAAPDALTRIVPCRSAGLLGEGAAHLARAIAWFSSGEAAGS